MGATIRDYRPGDEADANFICLKTGNHGDDGEPFYRDDPDALGRVFVEPYLKLEPALSLMLEDELGVCGYAMGALDSRSFYDRFDRELRPSLCSRFSEPTGDSATWTRTESIYHLYHHPDYFCPEPYNLYPSHLHIDLLPRVQRQGHGRRMMNELIDRLRVKGSPGVHLGMFANNLRAYQFYQSLGFRELIRQGVGDEQSIYMGKRLVE